MATKNYMVQKLSRHQMDKKHGKGTIGYADAKKNKIYLRNDLSKGSEKYVLNHEKNHLKQGKSGPWAWAIAAGSIVSGLLGSRASSDAADAQAEASSEGIAEQRRQFDLIYRNILGPQSRAGNAATTFLSQLYGLSPRNEVDSQGNITNSYSGVSPTGQPLNALSGANYPISGNYAPPVQSSVQNQLRPGAFEDDRRGPLGQNRFGNNTRASVPQSLPNATTHPNVPQYTFDQNTGMPSNFFTSPDYQYTLNRGLDAVESGAAAQGGLYSGATLRALQREGAGQAAGQWQNWLNGIRGIAGQGAQANQQAASAAQSTGNNVAGLLQDSGRATASGYINSASAINNAVQGGISNYLLYNQLKD